MYRNGIGSAETLMNFLRISIEDETGINVIKPSKRAKNYWKSMRYKDCII